jgi:hypothetical protein
MIRADFAALTTLNDTITLPTWVERCVARRVRDAGEEIMFKQLSVVVCISFVTLLSAVGCATDVQDSNVEEPVGTGADELSGACLQPAFDKCVDARGGGGCVKYCTGACRPEVERCARGGGGKGCAKRCGTGCAVNSTWTEIDTWLCGTPYGFGGQNAAFPGRVRATCDVDCRGAKTNCQPWWTTSGRPDCTIGVWLDDNQNPK